MFFGFKKGSCWVEKTASKDCPEGWESSPDSDFYAITPYSGITIGASKNNEIKMNTECIV